VHFCSNSEIDDLWESYELPQLRGTTIFWCLVVTQILNDLKYVGCQYLFLFAADKSKEEKLVKCHENQLNFQRPEELTTAKPYYDFTCKFIRHNVSRLDKKCEEFFNNYNPSEDSV
jgi:hypothetical protein